ncbi:ABC transporter ATP-binding protein [Pelagibius sp.]|uniref:ABC transporter ATP-binding protein n=1 Tax=Pelagibius sp. TaxID=1931238 RepID=UPI002625340D|nr:ABC transporter ATP-binding protein [Pelagibius sp.]
MAAGAVISLQGVTKRFGGLTAVDGVSVDLVEGEFFALLGPSGCGKTTLLRMVAGFEEPDEGAIHLDGRDMARLGANRRPINLMFQSYALFPHMDVRRNISYGLEMERLAKGEIARRVDEILEQTQLSALAHRKPAQLSGGQRQRVALARALIKRPRVLLLDEPLGALDKKLREQMQLELKRLQHEFGITFVVVTHDQEEALVLADRIALMNGGRIVQLDAPRALYEEPRTRFAAQFIGLTNLFEGRAVAGGIEIAGLGPLQAACDLQAGSACALSVRPERIVLARDRMAEGYNAVSGEITDIAYLGQSENLRVAVDGYETPLSVCVAPDGQADARTDARTGAQRHRVGETVWCHWRPAHGRILTD